MWHATPIRAARIDNRNSDPCARMLAAVAAALPETTSIPGTITWPNPDVSPSSNSKRPAILAFSRGVAFALMITGVLMLWLRWVEIELSAGESDGSSVAAQPDRCDQECRREC